MGRNHWFSTTSLALLLAALAMIAGWSAQGAAAPPEASGKLVMTFVGLKEHGLAIVMQTPAGKVKTERSPSSADQTPGQILVPRPSPPTGSALEASRPARP